MNVMGLATAQLEVFWTAFHGLPKNEKREIVVRLLDDPDLRQDLTDVAYFESRREEPRRKLQDYIKDRNAK